MREVNEKFADDSIKIKYHQVQTGWGSSPAPDFVSNPCIFTGYDIYQYKEICELLLNYPNIEGKNIKDIVKNFH